MSFHLNHILERVVPARELQLNPQKYNLNFQALDQILQTYLQNAPKYFQSHKISKLPYKIPKELETLLFHEGFPPVPVFPPSTGIHPYNLPPVNEIKRLNLHENYADHKSPNSSEHIQNWSDGCVELAIKIYNENINQLKTFFGQQKLEIPPLNTFQFSRDIQIISHSPNEFNEFYIMIFHDLLRKGEKYTLGYLLVETTPSYELNIFIFNGSTGLSIDILTLGYSTKRNNEHMAGNFGEGVKVEILRLLKYQSSVSYLTNNQVWKFSLMLEGSHKVLGVNSESLSLNYYSPSEYHHLYHTSILLRDIPQTAYRKSDYIFFYQLKNEQFKFRQFRCEKFQILFDEIFHSKVYLKNFFVYDIDEAKYQFGINIFTSVKELNIGRDRNSISPHKIQLLIPFAYHHNEQNPSPYHSHEEYLPLLAEFTKRIYSLLNSSLSSTSILSYPNNNNNNNVLNHFAPMVESLLTYFKFLHGENAIPVKMKTHQQDKEAEVLGAKLVEIKSKLFDWLVKSPNFPNLNQFWTKHSEKIFALPEFILEGDSLPPHYSCKFVSTFVSENDANFAKYLSNYSVKLLNPYIEHHQIRFKSFPEGNCRRVIPLEDARKELFFILDSRLFHIRKVHEYLESEGNICRNQKSENNNGEISCFCQVKLLIEDLKFALKQRGIHQIERIYSTNMENDYFSSFGSYRPSSSPSPPSPSSPSPNSKIASNTTQNPVDHDRDHNNNNNNNNNNEDEINPVSSERNQIIKEEKQVIETILDSEILNIINDLQNSRNPKSGNLRFSIACESPNFEQLKKCPMIKLPHQSWNFFVPTDKPNPFENPNLFLDNHNYNIGLDKLLISLNTFCKLIEILTTKVFNYYLTKIHLFWQDTNLIAFNSNQFIYFNFRFYHTMFLSGHMQSNVDHLSAVIDYWYVVYAHELAHNRFHNHNLDHERAMQNLIIGNMTPFRLLFSNEFRNFHQIMKLPS